jgi:hypothetical protein
MSINNIIEKILSYKADVIGITSTTFSFSSSVETAKQIKRRKHDIKSL